ncbi:MAG: RNA methyltransferase [Treponemataceae bacterium]
MRNRLTNELAVCGYNATKALADMHPEKINRLFLREELLRDFGKACKVLAAEKRPYKVCEDEELERLCKSPRHQGVVAMISEPEIPFLTEEILRAWGSRGDSVLILDDVGNDNNLGAIVRSAAFFGVHHIVVSAEDGEARLTTSAYRVAEGGMERVEFHCVNNMASFLRAASRELVVVGADHRARSRLKELPRLVSEARLKISGAVSADYGLGASIGVGIALGNEERGLSPAVKSACSLLVRIPGSGEMESLNVAQAATLFLHELYSL